MKKISLVALLAFGMISFKAMAQFTPGRVVVLRSGIISTGSDGALVEYLPSVANQSSPTYSVALPNSGTTDSGSSIVFGMNSAFNHTLSLSQDGALVVIPGYANKTAGAIDSTAGAKRVVATVRWDGAYARPINVAPLAETVTFRAATSDGFGNFWGNSSAGGFYFDVNTNSASLAGGALRAMAIANGNVVFSTGTEVRAYPGLPTTLSPGSSLVFANHASSSGGFAIPSNPDVGSRAYLADTVAGVQRYDWNGSSWAWQYTLGMPSGNTSQNIAVDYSGATPVIFVTTAASSSTTSNRLYAFTDTGSTATPVLLATTAVGFIFRGLVLAPLQPALPVFTVSPSAITSSYGSTIAFGPVDASNANPNGYTWKRGAVTLTNGPTGTGSTISGATTPTLTIANITSADAANYVAVASNNGGSVNSTNAALTLAGSSITTQLVSRTNAVGTVATFHVVSGGSAPLTYAWTRNNASLSDGDTGNGGSVIAGSASDTLTITNVQDGDAGSYSVTVTDGTAAQSISTAMLTVVDPPQITVQPLNQNKAAGATANFTVQATGGALYYQWFKGIAALTNGPTGSGAVVSGALTETLSIAGVQDGDVASYSVTVSNLAGIQPSDPATLAVGHAPAITSGITNSYNLAGGNASFSVAATGTETLSYIWKHNGTTISDDGFHIFGATTPTLSITGVDATDTRAYSVTVTNDFGSATSSAALFIILAPPQPDTVPGLIVYEPFNYYAQGPYPAVSVYSWDGFISTYNQQTGQPAYWYRVGGLNSAIQPNDMRDNHRNGGTYPWPGLDCNSSNHWYWSSAANNNHFKFGGVTNGSAYFSFLLHVDQSIALETGGFDIIAGFTSGDSTNGGGNVDSWNYKLCTQSDGPGGDGYHLGVFKGDGTTINSSSQNGQWAPQHLLRGQIVFVVGCYKINSGGITTNDDLLSLWINPPRSSFGVTEPNVPAPDAGGATSSSWNANAAITEFATKGTVQPASKRMADLRIGKTWASVTYFPSLKLGVGQTDATLSWPVKYPDYILQSSTELGAAWSDINPPYSLDGSGKTNTATIPKEAVEFFRLKPRL